MGIADEVTRTARVHSASAHELAQLVETVNSVNCSDLYGWLAGNGSHYREPSDEHVAITFLTMAADAARQT